MDKNTLSNYGWIVIAVLVLSVMIALATPFGSYIEQGIKNTTTGLFEVENNAMSTAQVAVGLPDPRLSHNGTIKEGAVYYVGVTGATVGDYSGATATYREGDAFPEPHIGDVYVYGDYEYRYNKRIYVNLETENITWGDFSEYPGWGVRVLDKTKTNYSPILNNIANEPISNVVATFKGCRNMITSPKIPDTTKWSQHCFYGCISLKHIPNLPEQIVKSNYMFAACYSLETVPPINGKNSDINDMFIQCYNLKYVEINCSPTNIRNVFETSKPSTDLILAGTSTKLQQIAETSTTGMRKVYDINGNIMAQ